MTKIDFMKELTENPLNGIVRHQIIWYSMVKQVCLDPEEAKSGNE